MESRSWQDGLIFVIGIWLVITPYFVPMKTPAGVDLSLAGWSFTASGIIAVTVAILAIPKLRPWLDWVVAFLGVWLLASPWLAGFASRPSLIIDAMACGALLSGLGFWAIAGRNDGGWA